jgi:hypothetical protein
MPAPTTSGDADDRSPLLINELLLELAQTPAPDDEDIDDDDDDDDDDDEEEEEEEEGSPLLTRELLEHDLLALIPSPLFLDLSSAAAAGEF